MGSSRPPLRVAFWAISAALLLMLLATVSDPYRVRQSMLARRIPAESSGGGIRQGLRAGHTGLYAQSPGAPATPTRSSNAQAEASPLAHHLSAARSPASDQPAGDSIGGGAQARVVSTGDARRHIARSVERPAMPILSPGELTGPNNADGKFEELPPPPELQSPQQAAQLSSTAGSDADASAREQDLALQLMQLETELLILRRDLTQSIESQQIEQIQHLQQQQNRLLERQQQTTERLEQLATRLDAQSGRLERLVDLQTASPSAQRTNASTDASADNPSDEWRVDQLAEGRQRFTLIIESDDVAGILERLGRWSSETALRSPAAPATHSTLGGDAQPRYFAPPPCHADPTPLSSSDGKPAAISAEPLTGGPLFVPPAICR